MRPYIAYAGIGAVIRKLRSLTIHMLRVIRQLLIEIVLFVIVTDLRYHPLNCAYYYACGLLCQALRKPSKAAWAFERAITLQPNHIGAWCGLGAALSMTGQAEGAMTAYRQCLLLDPEHLQSHIGLGNLCYQFGDIAAAKAHLAWGLRDGHTAAEVAGRLIICEALDPSGTNASVLEVAKKVNSHLELGKVAGGESNEGSSRWAESSDVRLKIGCHCSFFDSYGVRQFFMPILKHLDRSSFSIFLYGSGVNQWLGKGFRGGNTEELSDEDFSAVVRGDGIQILLDLDGQDPWRRRRAFIQRVAPIQVCYFNYPGTSGIAAMDYFLADEIVVPEGQEKLYTERVYRLRSAVYSFEFPRDWPQAGPAPCMRNGFVTFGFFGNPIKMNSVLLRWWATIVNRVSGSKLLLVHPLFNTAQNRELFWKRCSEAGFEMEQVVFHDGMPHAELLRMYGKVDLVLDPFPYNGGHTTMEALSVGVPVITLVGSRYVSRHGAAFLTRANLPELIATSPEEYIEKYISVASNPEAVGRLRVRVRTTVKDSPLCDISTVAAEWDAAFRTMWTAYRGRGDTRSSER